MNDHDPTRATEQANEMIVAHGAERTLEAVARVLARLGHHEAADVRNVASDLAAEGWDPCCRGAAAARLLRTAATLVELASTKGNEKTSARLLRTVHTLKANSLHEATETEASFREILHDVLDMGADDIETTVREVREVALAMRGQLALAVDATQRKALDRFVWCRIGPYLAIGTKTWASVLTPDDPAHAALGTAMFPIGENGWAEARALLLSIPAPERELPGPDADVCIVALAQANAAENGPWLVKGDGSRRRPKLVEPVSRP